MLSERELTEAIGTTAYGPDGQEIGKVEHFFVDDRTGAPTWVAVRTGLFGTKHSMVPALDADFAEGSLRVPVDREAVRSAPHLGDTQHLDPDDEAQLRAHYRLDQTGRAPAPPTVAVMPAAGTAQAPAPAQAPVAAAAAPVAAAQQPVVPEPAPRPTAPAGDGSMVRSEERLRVGTEQAAATRVRLVKYVVTEEVQVTVPVRREEIRLEEVPVDAPDVEGESLEGVDRHPASDVSTAGPRTGTAGGGLPTEIVLHREEPVVSVRVVATERVRLHTEVVQGQEQVTGQVQRERIAVDEQPLTAGS